MTTAPCPCPRCAALAAPATDLPRSAQKLLDACAAGLGWLARRLAAWAERRRLDRECIELGRLDDATLRDIGLARCEIASVRAEAEGLVERTRLRVLHLGP